MNDEIRKYKSYGVDTDKIQFTNVPTFIWSLTRECAVYRGGGEKDTLEVIFDESGNGRLSYENNIMLSVSTYKPTKNVVDEINQSKGIIVYPTESGDSNFIFAHIPIKK